MFSMWRLRLPRPRESARGFSSPKASDDAPPFIFSARMVATMTTASGEKPAFRQTIFMNFSPPRSEPKPASVTT